jgi:hypothetical protein
MEDIKQLLDALERVFWAREVREEYQAAWYETQDPDRTSYQTAEAEALAAFSQALTVLIDRRVAAALCAREAGTTLAQGNPGAVRDPTT